jgi:elongation factor G
VAVDLARLRNFGIVAHIDAGKTTVSERILFDTGKEHRMGEVDEGTAALDWMPEEQERGITITAAATTIAWRGHRLNLIDTPGHVDFTAEVERSLRVLDGTVVVFCGVAGVEAQSETVWRQADRYRIPRVAFVNKLDRIGADFERIVGEIRHRLGANAVPIQIPLVSAGTVAGCVDLVSMDLLRAESEDPEAKEVHEPLPDPLRARALDARARLVEAVAEKDEEVLEKFVAGAEVGAELLRAAIRRQTLAYAIVPVLGGSAIRNRGVRALLDAVVDLLPSPLDRGEIEGEEPGGGKRVRRRPDPEEPLSALAFKVFSEPHGELTYVRIYSGRLRAGEGCVNSRTGKTERAGRILRMHANDREQVEEALAGDIVALVGLRQTATGDTLFHRGHAIELEAARFPEPVLTMAIEPKASADRARLIEALRRLEREDPTFRVTGDEETGQLQISGMGELHLEVLRHRLEREFRLEANVGRTRVAYKETLARASGGEGRFVRRVGEKGVYGHVRLRLEPALEVPGIEVRMEAALADLPLPFRPAVEKAIRDAGTSGPRYGYPVVQVRAVVTGGSRHETDSDETAYAAAADLAFRQALESGGELLLEPIMRFEIQTPGEFAGGILADLQARRGEVDEVLAEGPGKWLRGRVPLAAMFGYSTALRSLSQGRASCTLEPFRYAPVPAERLREVAPF